MEAKEARKIIDALADGVDPLTGEEFPEGSPWQTAPVVRALSAASAALEKVAKRRQVPLPENTGVRWEEEEEQILVKGHEAGDSIPDLAKRHLRTPGGIRSRLNRLGLLL